MVGSAFVARFRALVVGASLVAGLGGCYDPSLADGDTTEADPDEITGANAVARTLTLKSHVYVEAGASAGTILEAVRTQTRTMFGPLREEEIGVDDRELATVDASTFVREPVTVVDTDRPGAPTRAMLRVRYTYRSRAVVPRALSTRRSLQTTVLVGNYRARFDDLVTRCANDPHAREFGADSFWYMFNPEVSACRRAIDAEVQAVDTATRRLADRRAQVSAVEVARAYLPVTVTLATIRAPSVPKYPEYDRLFGASDPAKTDLHVYAFFGVIGDREDDPMDDGYREMMFVLRNVLRAQPGARFDAPSPAADLANIQVNGQRLAGATPAGVVEWALTGRGPSGVSSADLRRAILAVWKARTINVTVPLTVTSGGRSHPLNVRLHAYYGDEGGASSGARQRYVSAWRDADVFVYSGHSHLGSGPLDPTNYRTSDFPDRYQIMMINSCVSYNYYNAGFYPLHPGGSRNLDIIVNGIEAYSDNGHAVSALVTGLVNGRQGSYLDLLRGMVANEPSLGLYDYDPLRVVDGETDNRYSPARTPITLAPAR